jgi:hypothetical protein
MLKDKWKIFQNNKCYFLHADFLVFKLDEYFQLLSTNMFEKN